MSDTAPWLNGKQAAVFLTAQGYPISWHTLAWMRKRRRGPPYTRFLHRIVAYDRDELLAWAKSHSTKVR